MTLQTITLARPQVLPQNPDCDCCAGHVVDELRGHAGVAAATLDSTTLVLQVDTALVPSGKAERLAREAGQIVAARYAHPVFAIDGLDCADCARTLEKAVARIEGVHYAAVNFAAAKLRLEYDREQISIDAVGNLARRLGYTLREAESAITSPPSQSPAPSSAVFACSVEGMCCSAEAGPVELAVRGLPGVQQVAADPALARLSVTFDPQALASGQIVDQVERLGFRVTTDDRRPTTDDRRPASDMRTSSIVYRLSSIVARRPKDALTALCGLLIAGAWLGGLLGASQAFSAVLYILATLTGAIFVARSGWAVLRTTRALDINLLMTVAAAGALLIGEYAEAAAVVFLFALGNALEGNSMERARHSIRALMRLAPDTARVLRPATIAAWDLGLGNVGDDPQAPKPRLQAMVEVVVPIAQVAVGETIVIRPGDRVPLDSLVLAGESALDQAPITGESVLVAKSAGAELFAGSINGEGALEARVTRPARDSTLARIIHMVEEAQARKSRAQRFIDVFARYYTPAVIALATLVAVLPPLLAGGAWVEWFYRALVLLVIACPCALVISTPVSIVSAIGAAARAGVLFKGGAALEAVGGLRAIAFDKTGTLTAGKPVVTDVLAFGMDERRATNDQDAPVSSFVLSHLSSESEEVRLIALAAAVEQRSTHPLARAVVAAAEQRGIAIPPAADFQSRGGRGASATVDGRSVRIGNRAMFAGSPLAEDADAAIRRMEQAGQTAMLVGVDGQVVGVIGVADVPRAGSRAAVAALRRQGVQSVIMLTGDAAAVARQVGGAVGVEDVRAELLPADKLTAVDDLLARYGSVGMVGDGVNDAPALARATVGIAMGAAGSDVALETADVTLMSDDLGKLPFAIGLGRGVRRVIAQNVAFALVVKAVFLVATLLGLSTLWMAVFADTGAALIVIANGMRLLRSRP